MTLQLMKVSTFWQLLGSIQLVFTLRFSPVTQNVGLGDISGRIAAFADFNADKVTDILMLNSAGSLSIKLCVLYVASPYVIISHGYRKEPHYPLVER